MHRGGGLHTAQTQLAGGFRLRVEARHGVVVERHDTPRVAQQLAAGGGRHHRRAPLQKTGIEFRFQLFDVGGNVGLHGVQALGGGAEAAGIDHGAKDFQGADQHGQSSSHFSIQSILKNHFQ